MTCNFHVGQKVVCVDDEREAPEGYTVLTDFASPVKGTIYTIRRVEIGAIRGKACVLLEEIPDQIVHVLANGQILFGPVNFEAASFRPVAQRPTDISIFKEMLNPQKEQVTA